MSLKYISYSQFDLFEKIYLKLCSNLEKLKNRDFFWYMNQIVVKYSDNNYKPLNEEIIHVQSKFYEYIINSFCVAILVNILNGVLTSLVANSSSEKFKSGFRCIDIESVLKYLEYTDVLSKTSLNLEHIASLTKEFSLELLKRINFPNTVLPDYIILRDEDINYLFDVKFIYSRDSPTNDDKDVDDDIMETHLTEKKIGRTQPLEIRYKEVLKELVRICVVISKSEKIKKIKEKSDFKTPYEILQYKYDKLFRYTRVILKNIMYLNILQTSANLLLYVVAKRNKVFSHSPSNVESLSKEQREKLNWMYIVEEDVKKIVLNKVDIDVIVIILDKKMQEILQMDLGIISYHDDLDKLKSIPKEIVESSNKLVMLNDKYRKLIYETEAKLKELIDNVDEIKLMNNDDILKYL